jgi:phosphoribosylglycinamide formyltransferase-1
MPEPSFISEAIQPELGTFDTGRMSTGEPGLPRRFTWRGRRFEVDSVLRAWKEAGPCHHGSGERYVRRHWYEVRLTTGAVARLYFERQARAKTEKCRRWWLFSLAEAGQPAVPGHSSPRVRTPQG